MNAETVSLVSLSAAMDGGFVGVADVPEILRRELGAEGPALAVFTDRLQPEPTTRMRTRMRALLMEVAGVDT